MGTPIAFASGTTNSFNVGTTKRGTIALNTGTNLTSGFNWWNGVDVSATQYLIYSDTFSQGQATIATARPTAWTTPDLNDSSLLALINTLPDRVGQNLFTDINVALQWLEDSEKYFLIKGGYNNIVTNGLVLNVDAGWADSYPGSGTVWTDLSGEGDNGTLLNGVSFSSNGNGSLNFDGSDDYVQTTNTNSLANFTAEVWFYPTAIQNNAAAVISTLYPGTNNTVNYSINWDGGIFRAGFYNAGWNQFTIETPVLNQWNHYVLTYNGSILIAYSGSGVPIGSLVTSNPAAGGGPTRIGRRWDLNDIFLGQIAIARVYNRALSTTEIQQNYNIDKSRFGFGGQSLFSGVTLYYDFGKGNSYNGTSTMSDISGNGYNGTNTGGSFSLVDGVPAYNCTTTGRVVTDNEFTYGNNYTIFAWARVMSDDEVSTWRTLFRTQDDDHPLLIQDGSDLLGYYDNNALFFVSYGLSVGTLGLANRWVLYTLVGNNGTSQTLYINDGTTNATVNVNCTGENHDAWGSAGDGSQPFGYINNVIVYNNQAFTQAQVEQYYDATKQYYGYATNNISTNGLILNYDASNPLSYFGSGTDWVNLDGSGNNIVLTNGPTFSTSGGGSIDFDGTDDYGYDQRPNEDFSSNITVSIWVNVDTNPGGYRAFCATKSSTAFDYNSGFNMDMWSAQSSVIDYFNIEGSFKGGGGGFNYLNNGTSFSFGTWVNFIFRTTTTELTLWANNVEQQTFSRTNSGGSNIYYRDVYVGTRNYGSGPLIGNLNGKVAVFLLYNRSLSDVEISQLWDIYKGRFGY